VAAFTFFYFWDIVAEPRRQNGVEHHYLIAEDDENTQLLITRAFKNLDLAAPLHFVSDGTEALEYLEGHGRYSDRMQYPLPTLVLLDLKMPRMNGLEVLRWLRQSPFRDLVVVMFSSSDREDDVRDAYRLGVNSFVHKPVSFSEFSQTISSIHHYWFGCNYFPNLPDGLAGRQKSPFIIVREKS
jgi:CheY-like chemotaxis protein